MEQNLLTEPEPNGRKLLRPSHQEGAQPQQTPVISLVVASETLSSHCQQQLPTTRFVFLQSHIHPHVSFFKVPFARSHDGI
jgi:hypothetical protein